MPRTARIVLIGLAASLFFECSAAQGDSEAVESAALLERAKSLEDLRAEGGSPFLLRASLKFTNPKGQAEGTYLLIWLTQNRWHEEVRLGDFSRVRDGVDGGYQQIRSWDYESQIISNINHVLNPARLLRLEASESVEKARNRKIGDQLLPCVDVRDGNAKRKELCFNPTTGALALATLINSTQGDETSEYGDETPIGMYKFPRDIKSRRTGGVSLKVSVTELSARSLETTSLPVPDMAKSEFWGTCQDIKPAHLVHSVPLKYPEKSRERHERGPVILYGRIELDGTVSHVRALSSPSPELAQAATDAATQYKYTPASCGGVPIRTEANITAVFEMMP
jgi:TonB family protein